MILTCSFCQARYLLSASVFAFGPRQVRCARCAHSWQADLPKEIHAVAPLPELDLSPAPEAVTPIPAGSNLPVIRKNAFMVFLRSRIGIMIGISVVTAVLLLVIAIVERPRIVEAWPAMESLYEAVNLRSYQPGEGLSFIGVRSGLRYEGGQTYLDAEGKILNGTMDARPIPDIAATVIGADGKALQSWQIDAPAAKVFPGEAVPFHSTITAPRDAVSEINLNFVESKHDVE